MYPKNPTVEFIITFQPQSGMTLKMKEEEKSKSRATDVAMILTAFGEYLQKSGKRPPSLSEFCTSQALEEDVVRTHFNTVASLEKAIWLHWFEETLSVLADSEEYKDYSARERLLSFFYTWMDTVKPMRNYMKNAATLPTLFSGVDWFLADMRRAFLKYAEQLIQLAATNEEIMKRHLVQNFYDQALWQQFLFVMNYWIKDKSEEQSKTDEATERAVNLFFELASRMELQYEILQELVLQPCFYF